MEQVGPRLRRLRIERGLTQRGLAEPRYTAAYVSSVEAGRRRPSAEALKHFAERLGVEVEELGHDDGERSVAGLERAVATAALRLAVAPDDATLTEMRALNAEAERRELSWVAWQARLALGGHALSVEAYDEAIAQFATLPDSDIRALLGRAEVLTRKGDLRYARHLLDIGIEDVVGRNLHEGLLLEAGLASICVALDQTDRAAVLADRVLTIVPDYRDAVGACTAHLDAGELAKAYEILDLIRIRPQLAQCHRALAYSLAEQGNSRDALVELRAAHDIQRATGVDDPAIRAELLRQEAAIAIESGVQDPESAAGVESLLRKALTAFEEAPRSPNVVRAISSTLGLLGDVLRASGMRDAAMEAYEQGLEILADSGD